MVRPESGWGSAMGGNIRLVVETWQVLGSSRGGGFSPPDFRPPALRNDDAGFSHIHDCGPTRISIWRELGSFRGVRFKRADGREGKTPLLYWGPVLLRVEIGSGVCFVGVTSISTRFGV